VLLFCTGVGIQLFLFVFAAAKILRSNTAKMHNKSPSSTRVVNDNENCKSVIYSSDMFLMFFYRRMQSLLGQSLR